MMFQRLPEGSTFLPLPSVISWW